MQGQGVELTAEDIQYSECYPIQLLNITEGRVFTDGGNSIEWFSIEIVLQEVEKHQLCKARQRWSEAVIV